MERAHQQLTHVASGLRQQETQSTEARKSANLVIERVAAAEDRIEKESLLRWVSSRHSGSTLHGGTLVDFFICGKTVADGKIEQESHERVSLLRHSDSILLRQRRKPQSRRGKSMLLPQMILQQCRSVMWRVLLLQNGHKQPSE